MLLSHIHDLLRGEKDFHYSHQIYEELINVWIVRESKKPNIRQRYGSRETFIKALYKYSEDLAVFLYENREKHGGYFLPKGVKYRRVIESHFLIQDSTYQNKVDNSKSLLNRDAIGNFKFFS